MIFDTSNQVQKASASEFLRSLSSDGVLVEIKKVHPMRSISQNAYLHLILGLFAMHTGYDMEEAKQIYKRVNRSIYYYDKKSITFIRSSADLDTKQMTDSIEKFRNYTKEHLDLYLPAPEDRKFLEEIRVQMKNNGL